MSVYNNSILGMGVCVCVPIAGNHAPLKTPALMDYRAFLNTTSVINPKNPGVLSACSQHISNHTCHFGLGDDPRFEFYMKILYIYI